MSTLLVIDVVCTVLICLGLVVRYSSPETHNSTEDSIDTWFEEKHEATNR
jgi:hypothetical protein